jgi:hypothetical protein
MSKHNIPCPKCQATLTFTFEDACYTNLPTVTVITIEHSKAHCNNCGRDWAAIVAAPAVGCTGLAEIQPKSDLTLATTIPKVPVPGAPGHT